MESWYVLVDATPKGPFTIDQMRSMAASGSLHRGSQVARAGAAGWSDAGSDAMLAACLATTSWSSTPTSPRADSTGPDRRYTFGNAWRLAVRTITSRYKPMLLVGLVVFAATLPVVVPAFLNLPALTPLTGSTPTSQGPSFTLGCVSWIYNLLVGFPLILGAVIAGAEASQGRGSFGDLFAGFRRYGAALGSTLVLTAIAFACVIVAYLPLVVGLGIALGIAKASGGTGADASEGAHAAIGAAMAVGGLITLVVLVLLMAGILMRVALAPVAAIDPAMGPMGVVESFRFSWAATRGFGWSMFGFVLVAGILAGLTVFLFCVGYPLLGLPLLYAMFGSMHQLAIRNAVRA